MAVPIKSVPTTDQLPVLVIGAGPIGLAAAAHLIERGIEPLVLEAGPSAGTAVRDWAHVRLFSPWAEVTDPAAEKLLAPTGWTRPDGATYPTGGDWAEQYLQPLADVLGDKVRYSATVMGMARAGRERSVAGDSPGGMAQMRLARVGGAAELEFWDERTALSEGTRPVLRALRAPVPL